MVLGLIVEERARGKELCPDQPEACDCSKRANDGGQREREGGKECKDVASVEEKSDEEHRQGNERRRCHRQSSIR